MIGTGIGLRAIKDIIYKETLTTDDIDSLIAFLNKKKMHTDNRKSRNTRNSVYYTNNMEVGAVDGFINGFKTNGKQNVHRRG